MSDQERRDHLHGQIVETHEHFVEVLARRLGEAESRELELYLNALSKLVNNLEDDDKSLRQVAQETFAELAGVLMAELAR